MRTVLLGAATLVLAATAAVADGDIMASRYGNTTITKDGAGNENHVYYRADGTFSAKQGSAETQGTWKINGGTICLTANPPIPNTPNWHSLAPLDAFSNKTKPAASPIEIPSRSASKGRQA